MCQTGSPETPEGYREQRPDSGVAVQRAAPQGKHGRDDAAADGLVAAAAAASEKKLAPVAQ